MRNDETSSKVPRSTMGRRTRDEAAAMEDEMPMSFGPPLPSKPSHELLGELLLELGRPAEARKQFEASLERAPLRALSLLGLARACERSGDSAVAKETWATLRQVWHQAEPKTLRLLETEMSGR